MTAKGSVNCVLLCSAVINAGCLYTKELSLWNRIAVVSFWFRTVSRDRLYLLASLRVRVRFQTATQRVKSFLGCF